MVWDCFWGHFGQKQSHSSYILFSLMQWWRKSPTSLAANIKGNLTKQETYSHDNYIHKYREVQSDYNKKLEFNLIWDLNAECEVHGSRSIVWLSMYAFAKPADSEFPREKVLRLALETAGGVTSLKGQLHGELLNAWNSYLFMHTFTRILPSQRLRARSTLAGPLWSNTHSCKPDLFLLSSETTSGPVSNGSVLKMCR